MTEAASYKKEVRNRKKELESKKVQLISKLCGDEEPQKREKKLDS